MIGDESPIHADLSDITVLYYPNLNWKIDWDGGTIFYKNDKSDSIGLLSYIPKRLVFYSGKILHKPATISKYADQQRIVIVIKLNKS
jgi:Rps23 Pro-64 3,4-dihydroxylase Tpa1-like proline 4-hydroxylase